MQITTFNFDAAAVRVVTGENGEPWFVAADVCAVLTIGNSRDAVSRLDPDEKGVATTDTLGGAQELATINESGLYSLIFTSRKQEAKRFKKWVTAEVLPTIRKTGAYSAKPVVLDNPTESLSAAVSAGLMERRAASYLWEDWFRVKYGIPRSPAAPKMTQTLPVLPGPSSVKKKATKKAAAPVALPKLTPSRKFGYSGLVEAKFPISDMGEYVIGGEPALRRVMLAHGLLNMAGHPTRHARETFLSHTRNRTHHWHTMALLKHLSN